MRYQGYDTLFETLPHPAAGCSATRAAESGRILLIALQQRRRRRPHRQARSSPLPIPRSLPAATSLDQRHHAELFSQHPFVDTKVQIDLFLGDHGHENSDLRGLQAQHRRDRRFQLGRA